MAGKAAKLSLHRLTLASGSRAPRAVTLVVALGLLAVTVIAYFPAIGWGGFVWDDDSYVTDNPVLRDLEGLRRLWIEPTSIPQYYPLVHTTFWIEQQLWGLHPLGYHLVNVLLHSLNAVLVWCGLVRLRLSANVALLAALVFAVHPVHVESVAWITERKNVLSATFYLLAFLSYLRCTGFGDKETHQHHFPWGWYALSLVLYIAALLSKSVTCSLPAAVLLIIWWKRGRVRWRDVWPLLPMFALGLAAAAYTAWLEKNHVGATGEAYDLSWVERVLIAGRALWFYAGKLIWPDDLAFIYERWLIDPRDWRQWLYPAGVVAIIAALCMLQRRIGRGPLAAVLFFAGTLVPALGFVDIFPMRYSFVADHFQYLASIGLITLFAGMWMKLFGGGTAPVAAEARELLGRWVVPAVLVCVLGALTWRQCWIYQDVLTLWQDTVMKNATGWLPYNNLGVALAKRGREEEAAAAFQRAIDNEPGYGDSFINLAGFMLERGRKDEAISLLEQGVARRPNHFAAHYNLGSLLSERGRLEEALWHYREALRIKPDLTMARINLAAAMLQKGQREEAIAALDEALRRDPEMPALLRMHLADANRVAGRIAEATRDYAAVASAEPGNHLAVQMWGLSLATLGKYAEAIPVLERALQLAPTDSATINALIRLYEMTGRADAAAALRQRPP